MSTVLQKMTQLPLFTPDSEWTVPDPLPRIPRGIPVAIDTEARDDGIGNGLGAGWAIGLATLYGTSICWREDGEKKSVYIPVRHPSTSNIALDVHRNYVQDVIDGAS